MLYFDKRLADLNYLCQFEGRPVQNFWDCHVGDYCPHTLQIWGNFNPRKLIFSVYQLHKLQTSEDFEVLLDGLKGCWEFGNPAICGPAVS